MAYEFLAAGVKPADPFGGFMRGLEQGTQFQQNRDINAVNIEAGKKRNELAGFELEKASKQVQAEKAWAQIPVGEDGSRDPAAVAAVEKISPEYVRTQKQAEIQLHRDELGQTLAELETASFLVSKAKTPQELEAALAKVKETTGIEVSPDEAGVLGFTNAAKSFADEAKAWDDAYKNAKTPEEAKRIKAHVDARAAEEMANVTLANLKVRSEQTKISANLANADKYRAQAEKARTGGDDGPPVQFLDESGKAVWGTRAQAIGKRPVPPAASLADQIASDKVTEAKSRVSGNLDALGEYYNSLSAQGAAVDTNNEPLANLFASARASTAGQISGKAFGTKEQSERNKINQMRPLLLQEIRQASAMGARGLDSNKELDFYLQAATDPSRDRQSNIAAMNVLSAAYGLGKKYGEDDVNKTSELANEFAGELPLVNSDESYKALKPGTEYRDKFGARHRKKR